MTSSDYKNYINLLILWAEEKGFFVNFEKNGDNCICLLSKIIEINARMAAKKQFYCLLHECGHILIYNSGSFWDYDEKTNILHNPNQTILEQNKSIYKIYTVIEEVEAWERAYKLALRLQIPINRDDWEKEMLDAINKYMKWAVN